LVEFFQAIASGFFAHAAKTDLNEGYKTLVDGQPMQIHSSSALFNRQPDWVIYHSDSLGLMSQEYNVMHVCLAINPKWLAELAPRFYRLSDSARL
jgi:ATP-dependent RNA helicase DHX8/PRP22